MPDKKLKPEPAKKWVGVEVYQLIVTDVHLFNAPAEAEKWFKEYTGVSWANYEKGIKDPDALAVDILGEDYDQTKIFELEEKE